MAQLEKIMSIYYGSNKLPYKDEDRQINYPVLGGNLFIGENNVTTIRFYDDRIGGNEFTWLAVVKLPDGSKVYRQLSQAICPFANSLVAISLLEIFEIS